MTTLILRTTARVVLPLVLVYSAALFFQGHDLPGGGFIAGVLSATGLALVYMAYNVGYFERSVLGVEAEGDHLMGTVVRAYSGTAGSGLLIAIATGVSAVLLGYPFLTQDYIELGLPLFGETELASAVLFDFGVYVVVVGAVLTVISVLGGGED